MLTKKTRRIFGPFIAAACLLLGLGQVAATSTAAGSSDLVINEFMAANGSGLRDEDGDYSDWIEIYNQSNEPINLAGWSLTDDPSQPVKWPFPDLSLDSNQYLVVFASGKNKSILASGTALHTNFKLSKEGAYLGLHNVLEGRFIDEVGPEYPAQLRDVSYGRYGADAAFGYMARPTPGGPNDESLVWLGAVGPVTFSEKHGLYEAPITVELSSQTPGAVIRYTADGSEPLAGLGSIYEQPLAIAGTTLLRAAAFKPDYLPSQVGTQTYIFLADVLSQPAAPDGFPPTWQTQLSQEQGLIKISPVPADYEMDPALSRDPQARDQIAESLEAAPILSLVMAPDSFAELHTHPDKRGRKAEQAVSMEFISAQLEFQVNAGLRISGDAARSERFPKKSFRLSFRDDYGPTKLRHPLFPDSPVQEFDSLVLRAGLAPGDNLSNPAENLSIYGRNEWLRQSQAVMSGLATHGNFVHLYLNGLYWGLYNLLERPDTSFTSAYLGGEDDDWFIANEQGPLGNSSDRPDKHLANLFTAITIPPAASTPGAQSGSNSSDAFEAAVARIDPAQLSDFIILSWYAEAQGWPQPNWYAAIRFEDQPGRGKFLIGEEELDPALQGPQTGQGEAAFSTPSTATLLFEAMVRDPDARMVLADRLYKHLFRDGALADSNAKSRWAAITPQIDRAFSAEAARWGDAAGIPPFAATDWPLSHEKELVKMEGQAADLVTLAREAGFYPLLDPPEFDQPGGLVEAGFILNLIVPTNPAAEIYYTTDGSDPRLSVSGSVSPTASVLRSPLTLAENVRVMARAYDGTSWSALNEASFSVVEQDSKLRLTEIMYNPAAGDDFEFIELRNTGNSEFDLANTSFVEGIRFLFPPNTPPLAPGEYAVLVRNPGAFREQYPGVEVSGVYDSALSNKGERVVMVGANLETLVDVTYDDSNGWPISPDGRGDSLVVIDSDGDPNNPKNWRASTELDGSPGRAD
jgi:hypothetical protein